MDSNKPKKLLMISNDPLIFEEGSAVRARQIEYARAWDEVHIVVLEKKSRQIKDRRVDGPKAEEALSPNCWVYSSMSASKIRSPFDAIRLGSFICKGRGITDITCQDPFLTGMVGVALKKRFGLPLEIQVHTDIGSPHFTYSLANRVRKFLALNYLPKADTVRVVSERIKDYLVNRVGIQAAKIRVQPIRVDTDSISNAPVLADADLHKKFPQFEKIILMVSRLEAEKNFGLALRAFELVLQKKPKTGLVIVGTGSVSIKATDHVKMLGWANKQTLASYYKSADLFLSTSLFEGYGMTFVEAKAAGLPIVSTDVGVAREMGATVASFKPEDVTEKILQKIS